MLLPLSTYHYYRRVFQFKNTSNMTDKYLAGQNVPWQVYQSWYGGSQLTSENFCIFLEMLGGSKIVCLNLITRLSVLSGTMSW